LRDGETKLSTKFNGRPNSLESRRPGSPPPELLTYNTNSATRVWEWHFCANSFNECASQK